MVNFNTMKHRIYSHGQLRFMDINWQTKSLEWTWMVERVEGRVAALVYIDGFRYFTNMLLLVGQDRTGPSNILYHRTLFLSVCASVRGSVGDKCP